MVEILDGVKTTTARVLRITQDRIMEPSAATNITAASGITPTAPLMRVQGNGGAITVTANPQIVAGIDGQVLIVEGNDDTNTVTLADGTGLHLHSGAFTLGAHDTIVLVYDANQSEWQEQSRNAVASEKAWAFMSRDANTGSNYVGGHYEFGASDNDFNPSINFGTANAARGAHFFIVAAAGGGGGTDTVIRVTGTSMTDAGVRATSDTEDLTADDAGAAGAYYETAKKWIGQIAIEKISGPDLLCNHGFCKYWDNNNNDFRLVGFEATWLGAKNDNTPDIILRHHNATGWTYNNGSTPTPPTAIASMATDYDTEIRIRTDEEGAWKRDNLTTTIDGSGSEGIIIELVTTTNRTYAIGNFILRIRPD